MLTIIIKRRKMSFAFKYDETKNDRVNNARNVYGDVLIVMNRERQVFACGCQSVSNHPDSSPTESIAPGKFKVRLFASRRSYAHPVHEIIHAKDIEGDVIDENAIQPEEKDGIPGRWLIHDDFNPKTGRPYTSPLSAGCVIIRTDIMKTFNEVLKDAGAKSGDIIDAELIDIN